MRAGPGLLRAYGVCNHTNKEHAMFGRFIRRNETPLVCPHCGGWTPYAEIEAWIAASENDIAAVRDIDQEDWVEAWLVREVAKEPCLKHF